MAEGVDAAGGSADIEGDGGVAFEGRVRVDRVESFDNVRYIKALPLHNLISPAAPQSQEAKRTFQASFKAPQNPPFVPIPADPSLALTTALTCERSSFRSHRIFPSYQSEREPPVDWTSMRAMAK